MTDLSPRPTGLRHIVLLGFQADIPAETVREIERRFAALETLVPSVAWFEFGPNVSPEGLNAGHTHAFVLGFATDADRDAYLVHPDHVAFADWVKPHVAALTVFDYRPQGA